MPLELIINPCNSEHLFCTAFSSTAPMQHRHLVLCSSCFDQYLQKLHLHLAQQNVYLFRRLYEDSGFNLQAWTQAKVGTAVGYDEHHSHV